MQLVTGSAQAVPALIGGGGGATTAPAAAADGMAPWIETAACTACDECMKINPRIFEYNAEKKAVIRDPRGGPFKDIVRAAERCTARVIHPGLPSDRSEKGIDALIKRAEKYN
jgi:pyruvate-ferredoxin/flavodoxin oxidoreductase